MKFDHHITRRDLILGAAVGAGALGSSCSWTFSQFGYRSIRSLSRPGVDPLPPTRVYPEMPPATVAVAGARRSIEDAVREAVEAAGGMADFERGQRVLIKPNMVSPKPRVTTNPEVIRAVIRMVKERGCKVMVGDRSSFDDLKVARVCGFEQVCKEEGVELYPWVAHEYVRFFPKQRHWSLGFRMSKVLTEVDHWINVPILKNHEMTAAEFTGCLKAFVGVCHPEDRFQKGDNELHQKNIGEKIAELNLCSRPTLNIVDATTIMPCGGPGGIDPKKSLWVKTDLVLASRDRVACDSVALALMKLHGAEHQVERPYVGKSVWDQVQIYRAAELGIGQADPAKITIEDIKVPAFDEIKANWT